MPRSNTGFMIIGIILVLAIVGGIIFGIQTSSNITTNRNDIATLKNQSTAANSSISTLTDQLTAANASIASLKTLEASDVSGLKTQVASLTDQLTAANTQIASLKTLEASDVASLKTQIASHTDQITSITSQISSLKSLEASDITALKTQLATIQTSLTTLTTQVTNLATQVSNIGTTTGSSTLFTSTAVTQNPSTTTIIVNYNPTSSGTVTVTGSSSSTSGYIRVNNLSLGTFNVYLFGTGTTISFPVQGGYSYAILFGNSDATGTITATITGTFNSTTITSTNNLFGPQQIQVGASTTTALYQNYTVGAVGNFTITATSDNASVYLRITDQTASNTSTNSVPGVSATLTLAGTVGHVYSVYFVNPTLATVTTTVGGSYN
jgi:trimeric autotransporter adhesin